MEGVLSELASPCVGCWHQEVNSNTLDVTGAGSCVRLERPQGQVPQRDGRRCGEMFR